MPSLAQIEEQIKSLGAGVDLFLTKKEVKYLPTVLAEDEAVLYLTSGFLNGNSWLIVCTQKRVIFLDKGWLFGLQQLEIPLRKINSIRQKEGIIFGEIEIWDGANSMLIRNLAKRTVRPFVNAVNQAREAL